ncbi:unnamed protein product [Polarella glacialis]|uniref:Uncharacterized protein n=1 Tax=Polarella glacialis TaxID=89957 RepID=A0A813JMX2_POLGL|nr:unnamed protein product [Polarella glacialis]
MARGPHAAWLPWMPWSWVWQGQKKGKKRGMGISKSVIGFWVLVAAALCFLAFQWQMAADFEAEAGGPPQQRLDNATARSLRYLAAQKRREVLASAAVKSDAASEEELDEKGQGSSQNSKPQKAKPKSASSAAQALDQTKIEAAQTDLQAEPDSAPAARTDYVIELGEGSEADLLASDKKSSGRVNAQTEFGSDGEDKLSQSMEEARTPPSPDASVLDFTPAPITTIPAKPPAPPTWIHCAGQWQECVCGGRVRWGNRKTWSIIEPPEDGSKAKVMCSIDKLEDILPGDGGKHCECEVVPGSKFYLSLNPMQLPDDVAESTGSPLMASCELFESAKEAQGARPHDLTQWEAVEPFCSKAWEEAARQNPAFKAGSRQIDLGTLRKSMRARIDSRFVGNYKRLAKDGWLPRAFVNYYAGAPEGKHTLMTEELIRSVHLFSAEPIVVFHFGSVTPDYWTAERFPRLVLLHSLPLPDRSFNFNKLRSFLLSRVLTGVELDSDQFVGPGVDVMFSMTEREITKEYPIPIMPVHYYSFTRRDSPENVWWRRYCSREAGGKKYDCSAHTMRWGHAHPTWTFWALPFYGRWLRRHFRDERLPVKAGQPASTGIRVTDIPEDEDLLNVANWEERVTKQWCKYDNDRTEFREMLRWDPKQGTRCDEGTGCTDIMSDIKFYPNGAAKAFFTAHNCKDPAETKRWIDEIHKRYTKGLYPTSTIVYKRRIWNSGLELRSKFPNLACIL